MAKKPISKAASSENKAPTQIQVETSHQEFRDAIVPEAPPQEPPAPTDAPETKYNTFHGTPEQRMYSTPKIDLSLADTVIPEVKTTEGPPTVDANTILNQQPTQTINPDANADATHSQPSAANNLAQEVKQQTNFNTLSPLEQKQGTELSAEIVINTYDALHAFVRKSIKVPKETLLTKHNEGKIDVNDIFVPAEHSPDGNPISNLQFYDSFNIQVDQEFIVTEEFKNKVRPPLQRLAQKYGLAASDEVYLGVAFGMDIVQKGIMVKQFKSIVNSSIKAMEDSFTSRKTLTDEYITSKIEEGVSTTRTKMEKMIEDLTDKLQKAESKPVVPNT
jgi:hypothetical protein